jgi:hypothetical protein
MKYVLLLLLTAASLSAQTVTLGLKGGVPLYSIFDTNRPTSPSQSTYSSATRRYLVGPSAEFGVGHFRFEVDAIFKRLGWDSDSLNASGTGVVSRSSVANQWEFPGLIKFDLSLGRFRPFVNVGASLRHISSLRQRTTSAGAPFPVIEDNVAEIRNRNSYGGVAGIGFAFKYNRFRLSPEARYTRWANRAFSNDGLFKSNLDQADFIVGLTF